MLLTRRKPDLVTPDPRGAREVSFSRGRSFSPGVYRIRFAGGALNYNAALFGWSIQCPTPGFQYEITYGAGEVTAAPGSNVEYATPGEAQAANAGASVDITCTQAGPIAISLVDNPYDDNVAAPWGPPTWELVGRVGDAPVAWTPAQLPGLWAWYRADQGLYSETTGGDPVTTNGDAVARWEDISGAGRHLTQTTFGRRPTLSINAVNGKPALAFNASNSQWMVRAFGLQNVPLFLYVIFRTQSLVTEQQVLNVASGGFTFVSQFRLNNSASMRATVRFPEAIHGTTLSAGQFYQGSALLRSSTSRAVRLNNAGEVSTSTSSAAGTGSWLSLGGLSLDGTTAAAFLDGATAEAIVTTTPPDDATLAELSTYAVGRYAI